MAEHVAVDLLAYSAQVAAITLLGTLLAAVIRLEAPGVRYAYWRSLLALCLLLPLIQGRQPAPRASAQTMLSSIAAASPSEETTAQSDHMPPDWARWLIVVLLAGAAGRAAWIAVGVVYLRRLRADGETGEPAQWETDLQNALGTRAEIRYLPDLQQPVTFGAIRPLVLLPRSLQAQPADIRRAVLCHELFHVRRRDWLWVLSEETVRAVLWFHPGIWWLISRVQLAREEVVDACTVAVTGERRTYIKALLAFADETPLAPATAFARRRHLFRRMMLISKEAVMSTRRVVISSAVMSFALLAGSSYAIAAFPLRESATAQVPSTGPGPLEQRANAITPENPIPRRVHSVAPRYPQEAASSGIRATVSLVVTLDDAGRVAEVRPGTGQMELTSPDATFTGGPVSSMAFVQAAIEAVRQWQYDAPANAPIAFPLTFRFAPGSDATLVNAAGAPAGPAPAWHEGATRVGAGVNPPRKVKDFRPVYPPDAMSEKVQGVVILELRIEPDGRVSNTRVMRSIPLLDQAATDAVMQWEFEPPLGADGKAVPAIMVVTIQFTLK